MPPRRVVRLDDAALTWAAALLWLATSAALQWSVVRFRVPIVLILTLAASGLIWLLWRRRAPVFDPRADRLVVPALLLGSGIATVGVPLFTYLRGGWRTAAVAVIVASAVVLAGLLWFAGRAPTLAPGRAYAVPPDPAPGSAGSWSASGTARTIALVSGVAHAALASIAILGDPAPRIDVWVMLQQSSDGLLRGSNFYEMTWSGSPGVHDMYSYLPWMTVLVAPGRWIAGDVRWSLLLASLLLFAGMWALSRGRTGRGPLVGAGLIAVLVVMPGTLTQIDQAWTEPLLAALLVWWAVLVTRGRAWWAVLPLALACASKQHMALLLPMLLVWRAFGWRRLLVVGASAAILIAPWVLTAPRAFLGDTVISLINFHPIRFANTWYLLFLNKFGIQLPFWVTGLIVLGAVGGAAVMVARRQPPIDELLRWLALVLLVANLVNKQAFYNQFWLSAALVLASFALGGPTGGPIGSASARREAVEPRQP